MAAAAWIGAACGSESDFVPASWCADLPRPIYHNLERVPVASTWFEVYRVADATFAIYEPHQFQEAISYLLVGRDSALLFDTGMGIAPIGEVTNVLSSVPIIVVNSHTHPDHIGGNAEFERVAGMDTDYTRDHAANGYLNETMRSQVRPDALCRPLPAGMDTLNYAVRPFAITRTIADGDSIALGERTVHVVGAPGHTPDAIVLYDPGMRLLFTGDSFYEGPIYLFGPETDLPAYRRSVARMAALAPSVDLVLPGHNAAASEPTLLLQLDSAVAAVLDGAPPDTVAGERAMYRLDRFSLLVSAR